VQYPWDACGICVPISLIVYLADYGPNYSRDTKVRDRGSCLCLTQLIGEGSSFIKGFKKKSAVLLKLRKEACGLGEEISLSSLYFSTAFCP